MKSILFTIHSMPIGGAEKVLIDILSHFDYGRYKVDLLLYTHAGENLSRIPENVEVISVFEPRKRTIWNRIKSKFLNTTGLIDRYEKYHTLKAIKDRHYDAVISFCQGPGHKLQMFLLDRAPRQITWVHNDLSKENWGKLFFGNDITAQEAAYNRLSEIIHVSCGVKEAFNKTFKIAPTVSQHVVYNIVDVDDINRKAMLPMETPRKTDRFVFINSGRMVSQKKQARLVEAARILDARGYDFEIWILGDGPLREDVEALVDKYNLRDKIKLFGFISNPYPYLKRADVFVLSSSQEGFPIVVCEALALGKPIVATKVVGPTELLDNSKYGILVNEDVESIAEAMESIMTSSELRERYSKAAAERSGMFDISRTMNEIYTLIDR